MRIFNILLNKFIAREQNHEVDLQLGDRSLTTRYFILFLLQLKIFKKNLLIEKGRFLESKGRPSASTQDVLGAPLIYRIYLPLYMILSVIDENIVLLKSSTGVGCKTYESRYIIANSIFEIIEFFQYLN
jgi:hypothetical protein